MLSRFAFDFAFDFDFDFDFDQLHWFDFDWFDFDQLHWDPRGLPAALLGDKAEGRGALEEVEDIKNT